MRILYIVACCLLFSAIVFDIAGKKQFSSAARGRARILTAQPMEQEQIKQESTEALSHGNRLAITGMVMATGGLLFWIASAIVGRNRDTRLTPVPPLGLLAVYVLSLLVAV